jgi:hypothetical protein
MAARLEVQFMHRWDMMLTDLHYAGALLNPFLMNIMEIQNNGTAKHTLNRIVQKLSSPLEVDFNEVINELIQYEDQQGPYGLLEAPNIREGNLLPHQWWHRVGGNALRIIAKRILSLTCSASSCERNWSMYSFVHNKTWNRLGVDKFEALVYIYTNSHLLRQRPGAVPCATMMTISSRRIPMMMVEHSWRRMTMTMMATMTTMAMEAKATTAAMEILLMEEDNITERTFQSFLKIRILKPHLIGMGSMKK